MQVHKWLNTLQGPSRWWKLKLKKKDLPFHAPTYKKKNTFISLNLGCEGTWGDIFWIWPLPTMPFFFNLLAVFPQPEAAQLHVLSHKHHKGHVASHLSSESIVAHCLTDQLLSMSGKWVSKQTYLPKGTMPPEDSFYWMRNDVPGYPSAPVFTQIKRALSN